MIVSSDEMNHALNLISPIDSGGMYYKLAMICVLWMEKVTSIFSFQLLENRILDCPSDEQGIIILFPVLENRTLDCPSGEEDITILFLIW